MDDWSIAQAMAHQNEPAALPNLLGFDIDSGSALTLILLLAALAWYLTRLLTKRALVGLIAKTRTTWDDALLEAGVFNRLAWLAPLVLIHFGLGFVPRLHPDTLDLVQRLLFTGLITVSTTATIAFLGACNSIYNTLQVARQRPIKVYLQVLQIICGVIGAVFVIAKLTGNSPWGLLTAIGTMTAILLLIFKDTILGLVASIQLAGNDIVRVGDWIEMPAYGADGDIIDIALHTVKVQNFDKTVVSIPTHKLIEGGLKNWRGMQACGGRRIKRSLKVDLNTIRFLDDDEVDDLANIALLHDYLTEKKRLVQGDNSQLGEHAQRPANRRRLTNIGTLRAYIAAYLRNRRDIHQQGLTFLVRQLPPSETGLPIEIYVFTTTTSWADYEAIQADIFDHILAFVPELGLRVYQQPSGADVTAFLQPRSAGAAGP